MKINITKEEYLKHLGRIPKDLVDAYFADETQDKIETIAEKYTLLDTQIQRLRENTAWALIGLLHPDSLKDIFIKDLGVSMVVAAAIVGDLNHEIFIPHKKSITEVLLTYPPKKEWLEATAPSTPPPTPKPIAPISPRAAQPTPQIPISKSQTINIPPAQQQNIKPAQPPTQPAPTFRPIAPPPLQTARPLGSRPSILEVQRGTDGIRRAPQAPIGGYETRSNPSTGSGNTTSTPQTPTPPVIPDAPRAVGNPEPFNSSIPSQKPAETPQTPHIMFKYTHPEPPAVNQISNPKFQIPNPTNQIPNQKILDTYEQDTFHKTQEEHGKSLPTEHQVMDLEEYHITQENPSTSSGNIVQGGNMLNLKE